jgi:hypothetical protein
MAEVINLPAVFQTWEKTESILRRHLDGYLSETDEEFVIARFKEIFEKLPCHIDEISLSLEGLEGLPEKDLDIIYGAIGSAVDQVLEKVQVFAGCVLGEIFALVLELWRTETKAAMNYE